MNDEILLSISIPTYNRSVYLEECLNSIVQQIDINEKAKIEIYISDNGSTDDTYEVVKKYINNFNIKYYKSETNKGMDANYYNCIYMPTGKYIHLMSDDDIMLPNTINKILEFIDRFPDVSIVHLNTCGFEGEYDNKNIFTPRLNLTDDICTKNKDEFINSVGIYITFISSIIINKSKLIKVNNPKEFFQTYFLCSHIPLQITKGDEMMGIISHNCIAARGGNSGGYNIFEVWVKQYNRLLLETGVDAGYSKSTMKKLYYKSMYEIVRYYIIDVRFRSARYDISKKAILLKYTFTHPEFWIKLYPYVFLPVKMISLIRQIKSKIRNNILTRRK